MPPPPPDTTSSPLEPRTFALSSDMLAWSSRLLMIVSGGQQCRGFVSFRFVAGVDTIQAVVSLLNTLSAVNSCTGIGKRSA